MTHATIETKYSTSELAGPPPPVADQLSLGSGVIQGPTTVSGKNLRLDLSNRIFEMPEEERTRRREYRGGGAYQLDRHTVLEFYESAYEECTLDGSEIHGDVNIMFSSGTFSARGTKIHGNLVIYFSECDYDFENATITGEVSVSYGTDFDGIVKAHALRREILRQLGHQRPY